MSKTQIPWTDKVWNPISGCTPVSAGCANCYAARMVTNRHSKNPKLPKYYGKPFDLVQCHEDTLLLPIRWKKPQRIFVNSMGDLFHEDVPDSFIDRVFAVMALCPQHTFQILTKRPERMRDYMTKDGFGRWSRTDFLAHIIYQSRTRRQFPFGKIFLAPLPNVHLGVSVENQATAEERIPPLLGTPAAFRFASAEPMLNEIDLFEIFGIWQGARALINALTGETLQMNGCVSRSFYTPHLDLVIVGGETGPKARPMHPDWAESIRDQCASAHVPFMFKQWGEWAPGECVERTKGFVAVANFWDGEWSYGRENLADEGGHRDDQPDVYRVGKKEAGRTLDGEIWDGAL